MGDTDKFAHGPGADGSFEYVLDGSGLHDPSDTFDRPEPVRQQPAPEPSTPASSESPIKWLVAAAVAAVVIGGGAFALLSNSGDAASTDEPEMAGGFKPYTGGGKKAERSAPVEVAEVQPDSEPAEAEEQVIEESEPVPDEPGWDLEEPEEVPVDVEVVEETVGEGEEEDGEIADAEAGIAQEEEPVRALRVPRAALKRSLSTPLRPKMPTPTIGNTQLVDQGRFKKLPIRTINPSTGELEVQTYEGEGLPEEGQLEEEQLEEEQLEEEQLEEELLEEELLEEE